MKNIYISLWLSLSIVLSLFLFKPIDIILGNPTVFFSSFNSLLEYYVMGMLPYWLGLFAVSMIVMLSDKANRTWVATLFALTLLFFIQSNVIAWDYGILNGQAIEWNSFWHREIADLVLWIAILSAAIAKRELIFKNVTFWAPAIIIIQLIPLLIGFMNIENNDRPKGKEVASVEYSIDQTKRFVFSKNKNIFVFVLDTISDSSVKKILNENPELATELDGFVEFDNMLGTGGYTYFSVPAYFTGKPYLNQTNFTNYSSHVFNSEGSLLKQLRADNWNTGFYRGGILRSDSINPELLTEIINKENGNSVIDDPDLKALSFYLATPQSIKRYLYDLFDLSVIWEDANNYAPSESSKTMLKLDIEPFPESSSDLIFMNEMLESSTVEYSKPSFKYFHLKGGHHPYLVDKNLNKNKSSKDDMVYVSLKMAIRFIHILKELNIYDSSQIYIMADHGFYGVTSDIDKAKTYISSYKNQAATMFMFKDFSSRGELVINSKPLSYFDFPSIVMDLSNKRPAISVGEALEEFERDERNFYTFSHVRGDYYPKIIEFSVGRDINNSQSWSLTGRTFLPDTAKDKREFSCDDDSLSLTDINEFIHYISDGIRNGTGMTRGRKIIFKLPLSEDCGKKDILINLKAAAVLGVDTRSGEAVRKRVFQIRVGDSSTQKLTLNSDVVSDVKILFPSNLVKNQTLEFSLDLLDVVPGSQFLDSTGKPRHQSSLKLHSLEFNKQVTGNKYNKLNPVVESIGYNKRLSDIRRIGVALENYHKANDSFPLSKGWDGRCTKWGESTVEFIYGLVPKYIDALPIDPAKNKACGKGYLYKSNGKDFKFLAHSVPKYDIRKVDKNLVDPIRKGYAYGIWSEGAKKW